MRLALLTDGPVVVLAASQNVDVAFSLEKMIVVSTFEAAPPITVFINAFSDFQCSYG